jgi:hypothetical protein
VRDRAPRALARIARGIVRVKDGRGFVVAHKGRRLIVTAAHCLPGRQPSAKSVLTAGEHTYRAIVGPLGRGRRVAAQCLFLEPISDVAVLGSPDPKTSPQAAKSYAARVARLAALRIADAPRTTEAWIRDAEGRWRPCIARRRGEGWWISEADTDIATGMSGSPIVTARGAAIGILCASSGTEQTDVAGGPNPSLVRALPGWLVGGR